MSASERPPDCECQDEIGELPCDRCYREGFTIAASKVTDQ
jgi:hypothetical protein